MLGLSKLWQAITRLSCAIEGLAETAEAANNTARIRLGLDAPEREVLPAPAAEEEEPEPAGANGRRRKR